MSWLGLLSLLTLSVLAVAIFSVAGSTEKKPPAIFAFFLLLLLVGYYWYFTLQIPSAIIWTDDGTIVFNAVIRTITMSPNEIVSIKPAFSTGIGFLAFRFRNRKILLLNQFDDFHEFITRLKSANPAIEIRGC